VVASERSAAAPLAPSPVHTRVWAPAALVAATYAVWLLMFLGGHDARDLIRIGPRYVTRSQASTVITLDPHYRYPGFHRDYDGQFYYYIALDPLHARPYLDEPSTRYTRIVYPMLARLVALGQPGAVPYALAWINVAAIVFGTYFVAAWLARRNLSVWLSLIFSFYGGFAVALTHDLTDPLAYAFVALAIYLFSFGDGRRLPWAALAFALAGLTRELTAIFGVVYGLSLLFPSDAIRIERAHRTRLVRASWFLAVAAGPLLLWKAWLDFGLRMREATSDVYPQPIPFEGILSYWPWGSQQVLEVITIVIPGLICGGVALAAVRRGVFSPPIAVLCVNVIVLVILLSPESYFHYTAAGRHSEGVMMAALYCLPAFDFVTGKRRWWLGASAVGWLLVTPIVFLGYAVCSPFAC
jgi:4-amino-4-deoxy-L-arabinose transferase-like glycosyltransferase